MPDIETDLGWRGRTVRDRDVEHDPPPSGRIVDVEDVD